MTSVLLNRTDTDIVDLSLLQTGSEEATVNLKDALLDGSKDYHFCVSELTVPLQHIDMFGFLTGATELFSIHRRTVRGYLEEVSTVQQQFELAILNNEMNHVEMAALSLAITAEEGSRVGNQGANDGRFIDPGVPGDGDLLVRQAAIRVALHNLYSVIPTTDYQHASTYSLLTGRKFYDVNQFMKSLSEFARTFNAQVMSQGINGLHFGNIVDDAAKITTNAGNANPPTFNLNGNQVLDHQFLKFYLNCDGSLVISADSFFHNHFMIRFTNTGSALLGLNTSVLTDRWLQVTGDIVGAVNVGNTNSHGGGQYPIPTQDELGNALVYGQIQYQGVLLGGNTTSVGSISQVSLFQSAECRLKIAVESHLPVQSGVSIREERETNNREIASAFFLNDVKVTATWNQEGRMSNYGIESKVFSGQFPLIHQHSKIKQWNRLLTSYNLMFFRFFLNVHYRFFDEVKGVWAIIIKRAKIDPTQYWSMKLRFVSDA